MKFTSAFLALALALPALTFAETVLVHFDHEYDDGGRLLSTTECRDKFEELKYYTFGSLPIFPQIAAAGVVGGAEENCASCWELSHGENNINVIVVDRAPEGTFNTTLKVAAALAGKIGVEPGPIQAKAIKVEDFKCAL